jgi:hypothetical protein
MILVAHGDKPLTSDLQTRARKKCKRAKSLSSRYRIPRGRRYDIPVQKYPRKEKGRSSFKGGPVGAVRVRSGPEPNHGGVAGDDGGDGPAVWSIAIAWTRRLMRNGAREKLAKVGRKPSYNGAVD